MIEPPADVRVIARLKTRPASCSRERASTRLARIGKVPTAQRLPCCYRGNRSLLIGQFAFQINAADIEVVVLWFCVNRHEQKTTRRFQSETKQRLIRWSQC